MKKPVLFIQGGGEGAYEEDRALADSLQRALGDEYRVIYPKMPDENNPEYEVWRPQLAKELAALDGNVILVGHSAGASVLLRYLAEEQVENSIAGIFLIAPPFWEDFAPLVPRLPKAPPMYFYHSHDDEIIPFAHVTQFAQKLPHATIREFDGRGHQFNNDLSDVAADIANLQRSEAKC